MSIPMKPDLNTLSAADSLFSSVRWPKARCPRRAEVLAAMELVFPWQALEDLCRPNFSSDARSTGRPGYSLRMMIRCTVLQKFWRLSDDGVESLILDSHATAKFIGSDPWQPRPPSASKIRGFRQLLIDCRINEQFDFAIEMALIQAGVQIKPGNIVEPVFRRAPKRR